MSVKRYGVAHQELPGGEWIHADDYDDLKARADALADAVEHEWHSGPVYDALTAYRGVSGE